MQYLYNKSKLGEKESIFNTKLLGERTITFHLPIAMMFAERKLKQFASRSMSSSLCVKSPATDFGGVRAISSFQSSLATVLAPGQTKYFRTDICRKIQSSNKST